MSKKKKRKPNEIFKCLKYYFFQFSTCNSLNFPRLTIKTASPGAIISVPTLGSLEYYDMILYEKYKKT